jgi:hypothetical protein
MSISSSYVNIQIRVGTLQAIRNALIGTSHTPLADSITKALNSLLFECEECHSKYPRAAFPEETIYGGIQCWDCAIKEGQTHVEDLEANRESMVEVERSEEEATITIDHLAGRE